MPDQLTRLEVHNFRSLADVNVPLNALNVLFGPNGAGKSTLLDAIRFVRDCYKRGVDQAALDRSRAIGALWDGADPGANIEILLATEHVDYEVSFGYAAGRIEPFAGEVLFSKANNERLIDRKIGGEKASYWHIDSGNRVDLAVRAPEKLALEPYSDSSEWAPEAVVSLSKVLRDTTFYPSREADITWLKTHGSDSATHLQLDEQCRNLWSVLRNLNDRRDLDDRYNTIVGFMRESVPRLKGLLVEQTGPNTVYGSFIEEGRRKPILAVGVADGHLQMLILLTALFSEGKDRASLIIFDEPEMSLHPHALAVFAKAVKLATEEWDKQVFIATHSPVLISQFAPENILAAEINQAGETTITRVSEMEGIKDLLEAYAVGSLYMAEMIAAQSKPALEGEGG